MADTYSFTTDLQDFNILRRVADEASPKANFVLINVASTVENAAGLVILAKKDTVLGLADKYPNEQFAGYTLGELAILHEIGEVAETSEGRFLVLDGTGDRAEVKRELETLGYEINRLNNLLNDRTVRVKVISY